jgi:hypothetical protein
MSVMSVNFFVLGVDSCIFIIARPVRRTVLFPV